MKRKLTDNFPLKIMSLIVGIFIWFLVVNVDNPIETQSFVVGVELLNEAYVDETGMVCMVDEEQELARVTITTDRRTLRDISTDDIQAMADLQQAVSLETDPVMVPITAVCKGVSANNIKIYPQNLSVHLEEKLTKEFAVNIVNSGSGPGKGYEIGSQTVNPEKIRITGPESLVNKIDVVNVNVDVEGITENVTEALSLTVRDKNGEILSDAAMRYLRIDNDARVNVTTRLWRVRTDVKLAAGYVGEPESGYVVSDVTTIPETVSVTGSNEALETLRQQGNTLEIPAEQVDVSGRTSDLEVKVNLAEILPESLRLTSGSSSDLWVQVDILPEGSRLVDIPTSEISVKNKAEDLQAAFEIDRVELRVKATEGTNIDALDVNAIKASIDLKDREEGTYDIPVSVKLPKGYELLEEVTTGVQISKVSSVESNEE